MDTISKQRRSRNMSKIKSKNTTPELAVRKILTQHKLRYRLHLRNLPGKPDIVLTKKKIALFVNGCFWHQHENCKRKSEPKTNIEYWHNKLQKNVQRQQDDIFCLKELGWRVGVLRECQTKNEKMLDDVLRSILNG